MKIKRISNKFELKQQSMLIKLLKFTMDIVLRYQLQSMLCKGRNFYAWRERLNVLVK
jgi:hypothetical protein